MRFLTAALSLTAVWPLTAAAQSADSLAVRFSAMTAVTGYEQAITDSLLSLLPGSTRDRGGNVTLTVGRGAPNRVVFCPLDEVGYVVGNITDDGYVTLRRVGAAPLPNPIFDQQLEGHQVTLFGRRGPVPGVVGVRSTHLTRGRPAATDQPFTVDDAVVDVGASSRDEVLLLGVALLTPVALTKRPHVYGRRRLAAPAAGRRVACAALARAVLSKPRVQGTVLVAFVAQTLYQRDDLATLRSLHGPIDTVTESTMPLLARVPVKFEDTPVETVDLAAADALVKSLIQWFGTAR